MVLTIEKIWCLYSTSLFVECEEYKQLIIPKSGANGLIVVKDDVPTDHRRGPDGRKRQRSHHSGKLKTNLFLSVL